MLDDTVRDEKSGSFEIQSDGRSISHSRSSTTRLKLTTTRSAIMPRGPLPRSANAAYRHAVLYAACHDGVRHCQGSHRVFVEFLPGCGTAWHGSGEFFSIFLRVVLSPVIAVVMRIALLASRRSLRRHLSPFKL